MEHKTIIRTNDPNGSDEYVTLLILYGVSYPITSATPLIIDGDRYMALRSEVDILTGESGSVITTITAVPDNGT